MGSPAGCRLAECFAGSCRPGNCRYGPRPSAPAGHLGSAHHRVQACPGGRIVARALRLVPNRLRLHHGATARQHDAAIAEIAVADLRGTGERSTFRGLRCQRTRRETWPARTHAHSSRAKGVLLKERRWTLWRSGCPLGKPTWAGGRQTVFMYRRRPVRAQQPTTSPHRP